MPDSKGKRILIMSVSAGSGHVRAAEALRTDGTFLRADDLLPFWRADNAVAEIIDRINEILGPEPGVGPPRR